VAVGRDGDIWVIDLVRGTETRLTSDGELTESWPVWSPDGKQILYSHASGSGPLVRRPSSGAGVEERVAGAEGIPYEWSMDGRFVTYFAAGEDTQGDLYLAPTGGDGPPVKFLQTKFQEVANRLSPDGKFMTYASNESGRLEVYVQTFPATENKWLISTTGGSQPIWSRDGRELFYLAPNGMLMAVDIRTTPAFVPGVPRPLFKTNSPQGPVRNSYAPSADGKRFLVNSYLDGGESTIVVLLNWRELVQSRGGDAGR
jgi:Tol biopolymer transport system component